MQLQRKLAVPDNDLIPRVVRKAWKPAAELVIGGHPAELVADECGRALAADLREADCNVAIVGLAAKLDEAMALGRPDVYLEAAVEFLQSAGESPVAFAVVAQGERFLEVPSGDERPTAEGLVDGALRRLADGALFGSQAMLRRMHERAGLTVEALDDYARTVLDLVPAARIATTLARTPEGRVRAPASRSKASTAEMLGEQIS
jgi:hypothetical protein